MLTSVTATRSTEQRPDLPEPYTDDLIRALSRRNRSSKVHQHIYAILYGRRDDPPTDLEIAGEVFELTGRMYSQLQRRRREIGEVFEVEELVGHRFVLTGWASRLRADSSSISRADRYRVRQSGRCAKCGRTVADDHVKLEVDHIIPQGWGGPDDLSNLQPLCQECNGGKKDFVSEFDRFAPHIRKATGQTQPHRRIASLLAAVPGMWVPSELIGAVASAQQYQEDWQKRLRELRYFGWVIAVRRVRSPAGRTETFYSATDTPSLPVGDLALEVRRIEKERARAKRAAAANVGGQP
jgi:hypothetical protein